MLIDIMNDHGLEQLVHFPTRAKNTLDLILTSLPGQFQEIHHTDKLSDHDVISGTLKVDNGYPHNGRADKNPYPHDHRADKDSYPHDSNNQCIILRL